MSETAQRCHNCSRIIRGRGSSICPDCGGDRLVHVLVQTVSEIRQHSSILTSAITFCLGLTLVRLIAMFVDPRGSMALMRGGDWATSVAHLHILVTACTVLYLILRHYEGDFRALFTVSTGIFILSEGLSILSGRYGMLSLQPLGSLFNIALFMYGSLAVTAAVADGPKIERYQLPLAVACLGFVLLACTRVMLQIRGGSEKQLNFAAAIILLILVATISVILIRNENHAADRHAD